MKLSESAGFVSHETEETEEQKQIDALPRGKLAQSFDAIAPVSRNQNAIELELEHVGLDIDPAMLKTFQGDLSMEKGVPKLDFRKLKKVREYKDWFSYSQKLEESIRILRARVKALENDNNLLNEKYRKLTKHNEGLFGLNEKLKIALNRANTRIVEVKEKHKSKIS